MDRTLTAKPLITSAHLNVYDAKASAALNAIKSLLLLNTTLCDSEFPCLTILTCIAEWCNLLSLLEKKLLHASSAQDLLGRERCGGKNKK